MLSIGAEFPLFGRSTGFQSATGRTRCGEPVGRTGILPVLFAGSTGKMPIGPTAKMAVLRFTAWQFRVAIKRPGPIRSPHVRLC